MLIRRAAIDDILMMIQDDKQARHDSAVIRQKIAPLLREAG
jgi:hypothetical protein